MNNLESFIIAITELPANKRTREHVSVMKRAWAKEQGGKDLPTNITLFKTYRHLIEQGTLTEDKEIANLFKKRSIRSMSGIVPVQVLTKPFWCPGKCIFCPNDASMPKSYINTQPGAMRALLNNFDPYKQAYNRLLSLTMTGHETDKIEMIVLGGTRDVYPKTYKIEFIKGLYDACNTFTEFLTKIEIDYDNPKAARYTRTEDFDIVYPETIEESLQINETADHRIIGLTIETRPEYITDENCQLWRELGVTRLEMGIQTLHNDVHEANLRGHDNEAIKKAMHKLRQYGFKVSNHYMPGLYTSTPEKDLETFRIAFATPWIKSDELKFYPTAVIPNTELYNLYKSGDYIPIAENDLKHIVRVFKKDIIPPYSRIKRLARDFDTNEVVAGANTPNLRQLVMNDLMREFGEDEGLREKQYARLGGIYTSPPTPLLQRGAFVGNASGHENVTSKKTCCKTFTPKSSSSEKGVREDIYARSHIYQSVDKGLVEFSRELRKRETNAEKILWELLRNRKFMGLKWRRQYPVGGYIADFFCYELQLVLEVDGSIHDTEVQQKKDKRKEEDLQREGLKIVRITNDEVFESDDIIKKLIELVTPSLQDKVNSKGRESALGQRGKGGDEHVTDIPTLLSFLKNPLGIENTSYTSLSGEEWDIDGRMETFCVGGEFDTESERNFVCLCTRCREIRNKKSEIRNQKTHPLTPSQEGESGFPFIVVRRYRSSVGEELFISFEDSLGYLYGFTRVLLPDEGETVDYPGLGAGTALVRELHVYGSLQALTPTLSQREREHVSVQHSGFGRQLIELAEKIATTRDYKRLSIIAGVGVRKYYEKKLGYVLEGTYMVKEINKENGKV